MITPVVMPQLGLEVTEGTVTEVHVEVGARVCEGQALLELATDKLNHDVVAPRDGHVRVLAVALGDTVEIGTVLLVLADTADEPLPSASSVDTLASAGTPSLAGTGGAAPVPGGPTRLRVAPVARRAAADLGVDLERVTGTGPRGRITLRDVQAAAEPDGGAASASGTPASAGAGSAASASGRPASAASASGTPASAGAGSAASASASASAAPAASAPAAPTSHAPADPTAPLLTPMRRAIARRMTESARIPQFQLVRDVDMSHVLAQKRAQTTPPREGARVGVTDLLVQAVAETVARHLDLTLVYHDDPDGPRLSRNAAGHVGLAVATDRGLLVPVLRDAARAGLAELAARRERLVDRARAGSLGADDLTGAAITISNLGGYGVDGFTALLNPGEAAIVAVGRTVDKLVPRGRGTAVVPTLTVTMSFDHRVVDGAVGAAALAELTGLLEGRMAWRP